MFSGDIEMDSNIRTVLYWKRVGQLDLKKNLNNYIDQNLKTDLHLYFIIFIQSSLLLNSTNLWQWMKNYQRNMGMSLLGFFLSPGDSKRGHLGYCRFTCDIKTASSNRMNNANWIKIWLVFVYKCKRYFLEQCFRFEKYIFFDSEVRKSGKDFIRGSVA